MFKNCSLHTYLAAALTFVDEFPAGSGAADASPFAVDVVPAQTRVARVAIVHQLRTVLRDLAAASNH